MDTTFLTSLAFSIVVVGFLFDTIYLFRAYVLGHSMFMNHWLTAALMVIELASWAFLTLNGMAQFIVLVLFLSLIRQEIYHAIHKAHIANQDRESEDEGGPGGPELQGRCHCGDCRTKPSTS